MQGSNLNISKFSKLCRDCFSVFKDGSNRCHKCLSFRILTHPELMSLNIGHIDCDSFYASVEKSINPKLLDVPLIVGGAHRGVVATCCYIARINGVRSAMPISQAKKLCPSAVIISPKMKLYKEISEKIKIKLLSLTPSVEFVSIDEAYVDLTGTVRLHKHPPAVMLAKIAKEIETSLGLTISVGLSYNKFLSKLASETDKPRGFFIIGENDTMSFLEGKTVDVISGVGKKTKGRLEKYGITAINDLLRYTKPELKILFGPSGGTMWKLARGIDDRKIIANRTPKSISCEQTLEWDEHRVEELEKFLWKQCERLSARAKKVNIKAKTLSLKLKTNNFKTFTSSISLDTHINSAELIFAELSKLLIWNVKRGPFRLLGISMSQLSKNLQVKYTDDLFDSALDKILPTEKAIDEIREKFGSDAIIKGRSLK